MEFIEGVETDGDAVSVVRWNSSFVIRPLLKTDYRFIFIARDK
jgi:hypothetical protein